MEFGMNMIFFHVFNVSKHLKNLIYIPLFLLRLQSTGICFSLPNTLDLIPAIHCAFSKLTLTGALSFENAFIL